MDADNSGAILDGDGNSSSIELSIIDTSQNVQDDTINYQTADEENSSKYFSMIQADSTLEASCNEDLTIDSKLEQNQVISTEDSIVTIQDDTKSVNILDSLSSISREAVNKLHIHERIDAANILSGGVDIFDDNENSVDEHDLVIDDDAPPSDCAESSVEVSADMQYKTEEQVSKGPYSRAASFNEHFDMLKSVSSKTNDTVGKIELVKPVESISVSKETSESIKTEDQVSKEVTDDGEESDMKTDNYSALLQGNLPEGSSEVMLLIDDKNVEAVHIGENIYIYKNTEGDLTAIQIALNEDGTPNIKCLHVGKNEDGNLEVYEEQVNQIAVTNEELESMKSIEQSKEISTKGKDPEDIAKVSDANKTLNIDQCVDSEVSNSFKECDTKSEEAVVCAKDPLLSNELSQEVTEGESPLTGDTLKVNSEESLADNSISISTNNFDNELYINEIMNDSEDLPISKSDCASLQNVSSISTKSYPNTCFSSDTGLEKGESVNNVVIETQISKSADIKKISLTEKCETAFEETVVDEIIVENEETTVKETAVDEKTIDATAIDELLVEETTVEEMSVEETIVEETIVEETIVEEMTVEEMAADETAVKEILVDKTLVDKTAVLEMAIEETAVKETIAEETTIEVTTIKETAVEKTLIEKTTFEIVTVEGTPVKETIFQENTVEGFVTEEKTVKEIATEKTYAKEKAVDEPAVEDIAIEEATIEKTSTEKTTLGETTVEEINIKEMSLCDKDISSTPNTNIQFTDKNPTGDSDRTITTSAPVISPTLKCEVSIRPKDEINVMTLKLDAAIEDKSLSCDTISSQEHTAEGQIKPAMEDNIKDIQVDKDFGLSIDADNSYREGETSNKEIVAEKCSSDIESISLVVSNTDIVAVSEKDSSCLLSLKNLEDQELPNKSSIDSKLVDSSSLLTNKLKIFNESQSSLDSEEDLEDEEYLEGEPVTGDIDAEWPQRENDQAGDACIDKGEPIAAQDSSRAIETIQDKLDNESTTSNHENHLDSEKHIVTDDKSKNAECTVVEGFTSNIMENTDVLKYISDATQSTMATAKYIVKEIANHGTASRGESEASLRNDVSVGVSIGALAKVEDASKNISKYEIKNVSLAILSSDLPKNSCGDTITEDSHPKDINTPKEAETLSQIQDKDTLVSKVQTLVSDILDYTRKSTSAYKSIERHKDVVPNSVAEQLRKDTQKCLPKFTHKEISKGIPKDFTKDIETVTFKEINKPKINDSTKTVPDNLLMNNTLVTSKKIVEGSLLNHYQAKKISELSSCRFITSEPKKHETSAYLSSEKLKKIISPTAKALETISPKSETKNTTAEFSHSKKPYELGNVHSHDADFFAFKSKLPQPKTYLQSPRSRERQSILHKNEVSKPTTKMSDLNRNLTAVSDISPSNDDDFDGSLTLSNHVFSNVSKLRTYSSVQKSYGKIGPQISNIEEQEITLLILNEDGAECVSSSKTQSSSPTNVKFVLTQSEEVKGGTVKEKSNEADSVDNDPNSSADESTTSEHSQKNKNRQPRKQIFTPVTRSDMEIIFPNLYAANEANKDGDKLVNKQRGRKRKSEITKMVSEENNLQNKNDVSAEPAKSEISVEKLPIDVKTNTNIPIELSEITIASKETSLSPTATNLDSVICADNKSENNVDELGSITSSPLSSSAKRKRGRPKKIVSTILNNTSPTDDESTPKRVPLLTTDIKNVSPQLKDKNTAEPEKIGQKVNPISPFGKINETIVCPICFKTFRTENVLIKHVKHCNGVIDKESLKTPKKRKSNFDSSKISLTDDISLIKEDSESCEFDQNSTKLITPGKASPISSPQCLKSVNAKKLCNVEVDLKKSKDETPTVEIPHLDANVPLPSAASVGEKLVGKTTDTTSVDKSDTVQALIETSEVITIDDSICDDSKINIECEKIIEIEDKISVLKKSESLHRESNNSEGIVKPIAKDLPIDKKCSSEKNGNIPRKAPREKMVGGGRKPTIASQSTASPMSRLSKILSVKPPVNSVIACEICGKTFRQVAHMVYHRNKHNAEETAPIVPAEVSKPPQENVQIKQNIVPNDSSERLDSSAILKCEICQKGFRKLHHLVEHREVHNNESKSRRTSVASAKSETEGGFRCDTCDKSFRKLHHLVEHRDHHMSEAKLVLPPAVEVKPTPEDATCSGCGKSFRKRHHMIEHRDIHCSPIKKGKIDSSESTEGKSVRLSTASSTSDDGNNCGICGKSYRKLHHMIEHRESHTETIPKPEIAKVEADLLSTKDIIHECSKCYMVFPNENSLNKHVMICSRKKTINRAKSLTTEKSEEENSSPASNVPFSRSKSLVASLNEQVIKPIETIEVLMPKPMLPIVKPKQTNIPTKSSAPSKTVPKPAAKKPVAPNVKSIKRESKIVSKVDVDSQVKYKINPAFTKTKRRLSQPLEAKSTMALLKSKRSSESSLSGLKIPNAKILKTILEESTIRYSFPKSPKVRETSLDSSKSASTSQPSGKKTTEKVIIPVAKKSANDKKAPTKKLIAIKKKPTGGGRKSIDGKSLPIVGKRLQLRCCEEIFNSQAALASHRKTHKASRHMHKCDCGKGFDNEMLLKKHMDTEHTPPKSFECSQCGSSVRTAAQFAKHKRDHSAENNKKNSQTSTQNKTKSVVKNLNKSVNKNNSKVKTPEVAAGKSVKRKVAHGGVPLSDKMKKAIAGAKF